MAKAGSQTITAETEIFSGACKKILVSIPDTSAQDLKINVAGIHDTGEYATIGPTVGFYSLPFTHARGEITSVKVKPGTDGQSVTPYWTVTEVK